jgi:hypothetical protein
MHVRLGVGATYPRSWQEYGRLVIGNTDDPDVVISLRPTAWRHYWRQFTCGPDSLGEEFEVVTEDTPEHTWG